jgi:hypothetical protein
MFRLNRGQTMMMMMTKLVSIDDDDRRLMTMTMMRALEKN